MGRGFKQGALAAGLCLAVLPLGAQWVELIPRKQPQKLADTWEAVGDGMWTVLADGTLAGQRDRRKAQHQAWLYTRQDYGEYDLQFDYWLRFAGNSGVSLRDTSRARWGCGAAWDAAKTPSHIGYEVQLIAAPNQKYPSGSLYLFQAAQAGSENFMNWNHMEIQVRDSRITVKLNGKQVMEHPGDAARPKRGPVGLQLHDAETVVLFRNIRIREVPKH